MVGLLIYIEIELFTDSVVGALLGNFFIFWIFFFLYKAHKEDVKVSGDEQDG